MKRALIFVSAALLAAVVLTGCKKDKPEEEPRRDPATYGVPLGTYPEVVIAFGESTSESPMFQKIGTVTVTAQGWDKVLTATVDNYTFKLILKDGDMVYNYKVSEAADTFTEASFLNVEGAEQTIATGITASFVSFPSAVLIYNDTSYSGVYFKRAHITGPSLMLVAAGTCKGLDGSQTPKAIALTMISNNAT